MSLQDQELLHYQHTLIDVVRKHANELEANMRRHITDNEQLQKQLSRVANIREVADLAELGMANRWTLNNAMAFPVRN